MWLGLSEHKQNLMPSIPKGYEMSYELKHIDRPQTLPPITLHYTQKQVSFCRFPSISELTPIIFNMELTYLGLEASI